VKEGKLERKGRVCNRCGDGTFMAEHEDRFYCGKCGLTIWKENKSQKL
jgi:small subunit ribosomal protein S27Ae